MTALKKSWGSLATLGLLLLVMALIYERWTGVALHGLRVPAALNQLPAAAFFSLSRMLAAYLLALLFAVVMGSLAAGSQTAGRVILPAIDILQSVPVLGFFPAAIYVFVNLTGERLGVELASVFLIFTAMAGNLAFAVYESLATLPSDLQEAASAYHLRGWERVRRLLLPACVPKLVYNTVLSWASGWYFLIACEIIVVGPVQYTLPGLGAFLARSAAEGALMLLVVGLGLMVFMIVLMDTLLWRPLSRWATNFTYEFAEGEEAVAFQPWWTTLKWWSRIKRGLRRAAGLIGWRGWRHAVERAAIWDWIARTARDMVNSRLARVAWPQLRQVAKQMTLLGLLVGVIILAARAVVALAHVAAAPWPAEAQLIPIAFAASLLRLVTAYGLALAWTLPLAIWASTRPAFGRLLTPVAEVAASVPVTALFPLLIFFIVRAFGNMNLVAVLLLMTGMQWYLLFNLLAGIKMVPNDLREASRSLGLPPGLTWRRLLFPTIAPSLITGSLTAWGGGWNTLFVAEYFVYNRQTYSVLGLGALLSQATYVTGNGTLIFLILTCVVTVVLLVNRFFWQRLYALASERFRLEY